MPPKAAVRRTAAQRTEGSDSASTTPARGASTTQNASEVRQTPTQPASSNRPPVQRLQSLKKRTPSGSIAPSGRPASALSGDQAKPAMKYKPRAVGRRSKEEREAIEKLEQERLSERLKEAAAIQRGRRSSTAGRGSFRGRGGPLGTSVGGPLGSGLAGRRGRGGGFGAERGSRFSSAGGRRPRRSAVTGGHAAAGNVSDEDESDLGFSIDQINLDSSEEEDEDDDELSKSIKAKGKVPARTRWSRGLRPVRVERHEHEERVVSVNMESSSSRSAELRQKAQEAKATEDDVLVVGENGPDGVADELPVKEEPVDEEVLPDAVPHMEDDGLLPDQKIRVRRRLSAPKKVAEEGLPEPEAELEPARDPRELLRTKEEIEEYDRHQEDLEQVKQLFSETAAPERPTTAQESIEGDAAALAEDEDTSEKQLKSKLLGQLFLMQFPPMTPNLTTPDSADGTNPPAARATTETKSEDKDVEILENGDEPSTTRNPPQIVTAAADWPLPAGRVGKFNVHRSGRVTLDWGGISLELDRAAAVDFVQEALIVSSAPEETDEQSEQTELQAWSMGPLCGKFTVTPNWDEML